MRTHSLETIDRLKKLRREGHSIEDLVRLLSIPKTTIWHHIQGIKLQKKYILKLKANQGGSRIRKIKDLKKAAQEARTIMTGPKKYYGALLATLHWTEGNKESCAFTNTDPQMILTYLTLLDKCLGIKKEGIYVIIRYFTGMDSKRCLDHWSKVLVVPKKDIRMYYNDGGTRGKSEFGMCRLNIKRGSYPLKVIHALIKEVQNEIINAPVA